MNSGSKDVKQFCLKPFGQISNYYFIHCPMKYFAIDISIIRLLVYPACLPACLLTIPTYIPTDCQPPTMVQLAHPKTPEGLGTKNSTAWDKSSHYLLVFVVSDSLVALCIKCGQSVKLSTYLDVWLCTLFTYPRELSAACSSPTRSL